MLLIRRFSIAALLCLFVSVFARGDNGWSSNGGEYLLEADNPWNLGPTAVPYCVAVKSGYPLSLAAAKAMVTESIRAWRQFFKKYELDVAEFGPSGRDSRLNFPDGQTRRLALEFVERECPSDDDPTIVRFLFGVESEVINKYLDVASDGSVGVAMRQSYNHQNFRNGGYVWIAQFSNDVSRIRHVLLHEMGHIFGMPHDSVYVMDRDVALAVRNNEKFDSSDFGSIESDFWPYRMRPGDSVVLSSRLGRRILRPNQPAVKRCRALDALPNTTLAPALRRSFGLEKDGCYRLVLQAGPFSEGGKSQVFRLEITDEDLVLRGTLDGRMVSALRGRLENPSPGLVTRWQNSVTGGRRYIRVLLDSVSPTTPSRGSFAHDGREHAARLEMEKGIQLELFIGGKWWTLRSLDE